MQQKSLLRFFTSLLLTAAVILSMLAYFAPVKAQARTGNRQSASSVSITGDSEGMETDSLGLMADHPFATRVKDTLDWGNEYGEIAYWVGGFGMDESDNWRQSGNGVKKGWQWTGSRFEADAADEANYTYYAMTYSFEGDGRLSFDYIAANKYFDDEFFRYTGGLVVIVDGRVMLMAEGGASGSFSREFSEEDSHSVTILFNKYDEDWFDDPAGGGYHATISNMKLESGLPAVATIARDGKTVKYSTLQSALENVKDDETVTLLADVTENIVLDKIVSFTLDLDNHTVNGDGKGSVFRLTDVAATIKNGTITGGTLEGSRNINDNYGAGIYMNVDMGWNTGLRLENVTITGCSSYMKGGGLYVGDYVDYLEVEKCKFLSNYARTDGAAVYVGNVFDTVTFTGTDFEENDTDVDYGVVMYIKTSADITDCNFRDNTDTLKESGRQNIENMLIKLDGSGKKYNFTGCTFTGNYGFDVLINHNSTSSTLEMTDCTIKNNTCFVTAGINVESTSENKLKNTVITDNKAFCTYDGSSGGLTVKDASATVTLTDSAIYGNKGGNSANDIYLAKSSRADIPAAKKMKDGDKDFSAYVWRFKDGSEETGGVTSPSRAVHLTAYEVKERIVAKSRAGTFKTIDRAARETASGDTIKIVAREYDDDYIVNTGTANINKDTTIDLNGHTLLADSIAESDRVFNVASGSLTLTGEGEVKGVIYVKGTLNLGAETGDLNIEYGTAGAVIRAVDGVSCSGKITITLTGSVTDDLEYYNYDDEDFEVVLIKDGAGRIDPRQVSVARVTNPFVQIVVKGNDIVAVNRSVDDLVFMQQGKKDTNDGSLDNPVGTFERAKELAREKGTDTIYLIYCFEIKGERVMEGDDDYTITLKRFSEDRELDDENMIDVARGAKLTLGENLTLDGGADRKYEDCGSIVVVRKGGTLNIAGAKLINNNVTTNKFGKNGELLWAPLGGGGVLCYGTVNMTAGEISYNTAYMGGGVAVINDNSGGGEFNLSGGKISNNSAVGKFTSVSGYQLYPCGGGMIVAGECDVKMTGGEISYNYSDWDGGGVSLGYVNTTKLVANPGGEAVTVFRMYTEDGPAKADRGQTLPVIAHNVADYEGGGIFIQGTYAAQIDAGKIEYNKNNGGRFGGGGVYVNSGKATNGIEYPNGLLRMNNVMITGNKAAVSGGGIAACLTTHTTINVKNGSAIYRNYVGSDKRDIMVSSSAQGDASGNKGERFTDHIASTMLDGTPYQWKSATGKYIPEEDLHNSWTRTIYTDNTPADTSGVRVFITDNESATRGGGIGSNGDIYIGEEDEVSLRAQKKWEGIDEAEYPRDVAALNVWALAFKDGKIVYQGFGQLIYYDKDEFGSPRGEPKWRDTFIFRHVPAGCDSFVMLEQIEMADGTVIWSAEGRKYESVIADIMRTMYGRDKKWLYTDDAASSFASSSEEEGRGTDGTYTWEDKFVFTNRRQTPTSTPTPTPNPTPTPTPGTPDTGDNSRPLLWLFALISSGAALALLIKKKKTGDTRSR